jgi:hypothetical protein
VDVVNALLKKGAKVDEKDNDDWTALMWGAYSGSVDVVNALLGKGANVNVKNNGGWTPLMFGARSGKVEVVKALLEKTPFEVMSVVMGNSSPPQAVIVAISAKVALNQTLEMKAVEEQIAEKNIAIERKNGEAAGARFAAQAKEQAKAISELTAVLEPLYIEFLQAENIKGAERVYLPIGGGPQLVLPLKDGARDSHREAKPSSDSPNSPKPSQPLPR